MYLPNNFVAMNLVWYLSTGGTKQWDQVPTLTLAAKIISKLA